MSTEAWVLVGYLTIAVILMPIFGRVAMNMERKQGFRKPSEMSPMTCGIVWGLGWFVLLLFFIINVIITDVPKLARKIVTGRWEY